MWRRNLIAPGVGLFLSLPWAAAFAQLGDNVGAGDKGLLMEAREKEFSRQLEARRNSAKPLLPQASPAPASADDVPPAIKAGLAHNEELRVEQETSIRAQLRSAADSLHRIHGPQQMVDAKIMRASISDLQKSLVDVRALKGKYVPQLDFIDAGRDEIGLIPRLFTVVQVVDASEVIIQTDVPINGRLLEFWVAGTNTAALTDGAGAKFTCPVQMGGTKQFTDVSGSTSTLIVLRPIDLAPFQKAMLKPATPAATKR